MPTADTNSTALHWRPSHAQFCPAQDTYRSFKDNTSIIPFADRLPSGTLWHTLRVMKPYWAQLFSSVTWQIIDFESCHLGCCFFWAHAILQSIEAILNLYAVCISFIVPSPLLRCQYLIYYYILLWSTAERPCSSLPQKALSERGQDAFTISKVFYMQISSSSLFFCHQESSMCNIPAPWHD